MSASTFPQASAVPFLPPGHVSCGWLYWGLGFVFLLISSYAILACRFHPPDEPNQPTYEAMLAVNTPRSTLFAGLTFVFLAEEAVCEGGLI